jgi:hypothetical protein
MVRQAHHPEPSRRANPNDRNSKFKTTTSSQKKNPKYVWVIEYWNLRFTCNLVLGIWDFRFWTADCEFGNLSILDTLGILDILGIFAYEHIH